jgi:hypothetical protein
MKTQALLAAAKNEDIDTLLLNSDQLRSILDVINIKGDDPEITNINVICLLSLEWEHICLNPILSLCRSIKDVINANSSSSSSSTLSTSSISSPSHCIEGMEPCVEGMEPCRDINEHCVEVMELCGAEESRKLHYQKPLNIGITSISPSLINIINTKSTADLTMDKAYINHEIKTIINNINFVLLKRIGCNLVGISGQCAEANAFLKKNLPASLLSSVFDKLSAKPKRATVQEKKKFFLSKLHPLLISAEESFHPARLCYTKNLWSAIRNEEHSQKAYEFSLFYTKILLNGQLVTFFNHLNVIDENQYLAKAYSNLINITVQTGKHQWLVKNADSWICVKKYAIIHFIL